MPTDHRQAAATATAALVAGGLSVTKASEQVAAEVGVAARTVRTWIKKYEIKLRSGQSQGFKDFNERRRAEVGNRLVTILESRIDQMEASLALGFPIEGREIRELTIAFGVLTDKRRLEDGLSTDRIETETVPAREIVRDKIDELAERRKKRDG